MASLCTLLQLFLHDDDYNNDGCLLRPPDIELPLMIFSNLSNLHAILSMPLCNLDAFSAIAL